MSHATARPRQAGTSFQSQTQQRAGSGYENQPTGDLSTLRARLTAIPARPATPTHNWAVSALSPQVIAGNGVWSLRGLGRVVFRRYPRKKAVARRAISSGGTSSTRWLIIHCWPNGSRIRPPLSP